MSQHLSRRCFLLGATAAWGGFSLRSSTAQEPEAQPIPSTGPEVAGMASFDRLMLGLLEKWKVPGGSLAVMRQGRLVFARGYGWADAAQTRPVQASSLFRIASVSKPFTAVAILKLVEQGKLGLDESAWTILSVEPLPGQKEDARLRSITIRQLLQHSGGWDREAEGGLEPGMLSQRIWQAVGRPSPVRAADELQFMAGQPLQFEPGSRHAYSNFGYLVLGRVIEALSGESYEEFVQREVLRPAGIQRMKVGGTRPEEREADEVSYFDRPGAAQSASVFDASQLVARPDGQFFMRARDASGGWVGSAADLLRFVRALDPETAPQVLAGARPLLPPALAAEMTARPAPPLWQGSAYFYALGWLVRPGGAGEGASWWHAGGMPGTTSLLVRGRGGLSWAALFNAWPEQGFGVALDDGLWKAAAEVTAWPLHDLFARFP